MDLQWPHHGARNFTKAFLPESSTFGIERAVRGLQDALSGGSEREHREEEREAHGGAAANGGAHGRERDAGACDAIWAAARR
jgi:hypothetical protein